MSWKYKIIPESTVKPGTDGLYYIELRNAETAMGRFISGAYTTWSGYAVSDQGGNRWVLIRIPGPVATVTPVAPAPQPARVDRYRISHEFRIFQFARTHQNV